MCPDSIKFSQRRTLKEGADRSNWDIIRSKVEGDPRRAHGLTARHTKIEGLTLRGHLDTFTTVTVPSLPALVYGHNGAVLHGIKEVRLAYQVLDTVLGEISTADSRISAYSRLDVSFQVSRPILEFIQVLRNYKLPRAQKSARVYGDETIRLERGQLQIEFYDKYKQMRGKHIPLPGSYEKYPVTRIEVRFKDSKTVAQYFGRDLHMTGPTPMMLNQAVRKVLLECFPDPMETKKVSGIYEFLAVVSKEKPEFLDLYLSMKAKPSHKRIRAKIKKAISKIAYYELDIPNIVPEDRVPEYVDLWPGKYKRIEVEDMGQKEISNWKGSKYETLVRRLRKAASERPEVVDRWGEWMHTWSKPSSF